MFPIAEMRAFELLKKGHLLTKYELAKAVPCHLLSAHRALRNLHAKHEDVQIGSWVLVNHQPIPAYRIQTAQDTPKPAPKGKK